MKATSLRAARSKQRAIRLGLVVAAVVVITAAVVTVVVVRSNTEVPLAPNLVAVAALANETGDATLEPLGRLVAERLAQDIQQQAVSEVVPPMVALAAAAEAQQATDRVTAFAHATDAGLVLHGAYYVLGDSLQFMLQITDAVEGTVLSALLPVTAPRVDPNSAFAALRGQVLAALAAELDYRAEITPFPVRASNFEAYRLFRQGMDAGMRGEQEEALRSFQEAWAMDSTFSEAHRFVGITLFRLGRRAEADSVLRGHGQEARLRGDVEAMYRQAKWIAEEEGSSVALKEAGIMAWQAYRPREALEYFARVDSTTTTYHGRERLYWINLLGSLHMLQDYEEELRGVREARRQGPDRWLQVECRALVALGRIEEIPVLLDTVFALPDPFWEADACAQELRAHGHRDASFVVAERMLDWIEAQTPEVRKGLGYSLVIALYRLERWEEARDLAEQHLTENPEDRRMLYRLGTLSARLGDRDRAMAISEGFGDNPAIASLLGLLGQREEAMRFFREQFQGAVNRGPEMLFRHRAMDNDSMRGYPPFELFMRPRG
jgi:tetratricopeptide (TPR) repeat protein